MQKSKPGLLVGFAGTNGKTISALLLRHVLQKAGRAAIYFESCHDLSAFLSIFPVNAGVIK